MEAFVKIVLLDNHIEAQLVESILQEQNIPFRIKSFHDTAYDGLFQFHKGWGEIYAPSAFRSEIAKIIETVRSKPIVGVERDST